MASNRLPLIIPCHRVLPRSGRVGEFSAPGGPATKSRLLQLEAAAAPAPHPRSPRHPPPRGGGIYRSMQNH
ncbi:MAG: hypothetical protein GTO53_05680 [Planctomycetales bacterium]|nr:hypothetical protein [Planctomycetales bacterium]NIM08637.1 hypothetical protein [Planctomycetales bacterium]NIN08105.1 hypothetical protein [Planctomycetales bacterium]NIN77230.1 hypothetical protein [Planctomycetales bacterium]NIO34137.1 hypothetical protein [Planctomycetales bacterium]